MKKIDLPTRLTVLGTVVLVLGLACALFIYRTAVLDEAASYDAIGFEEGADGASPVRPEDSKSYEQNLELYGGKVNVLADGLRRWLAGLWHGKSLAYTVGFLTIAAAVVLFGAAGLLVPPARGRDEEKKKRREGP